MPFSNFAGLDVWHAILDDLHQGGKGPLSLIVLNGDIADFNGIKFHKKLPYEFGINTRLKDEIFIINKMLDHYQERYPGVKIVFIEGNHCWRFDRYLVEFADQLFDLEELTLPNLFKLKKRGIEWIPYEPDQLYRLAKTDLHIRHSPWSYAEYGAGLCVKKKFLSFLSGCTHRMQKMVFKDGSGAKKIGIFNPCMADLSHPVFKFKGAAGDHHVNGFSFVWHDGPWWQHEFVSIDDGRAVYALNEYIGDKDFSYV